MCVLYIDYSVNLWSLLFACSSLIRRLPKSTLFPYTTLFRSITTMLSNEIAWVPWRPRISGSSVLHVSVAVSSISTSLCAACRSEEHTSELQSRGHLVCRLLLEKKKKETKK